MRRSLGESNYRPYFSSNLDVGECLRLHHRGPWALLWPLLWQVMETNHLLHQPWLQVGENTLETATWWRYHPAVPASCNFQTSALTGAWAAAVSLTMQGAVGALRLFCRFPRAQTRLPAPPGFRGGRGGDALRAANDWLRFWRPWKVATLESSVPWRGIDHEKHI